MFLAVIHWRVIIVLFRDRRLNYVMWTLELCDVVYAEEYLGAACSLFSGVDLEVGSCVASKI